MSKIVISKSISVLVLFVLFHVQLFGQVSYNISGTITDKISGERLVGATVQVNDGSLVTTSNLDGYFSITGITNPNINLKVSFIGYKPHVQSFNLQNQKATNLKIRLDQVAEEVDQVTIEGDARGTIKARLEQKNAVNIKNVVSSEQIQEFPDLNAAEVMQRIPGITVQRDQGEGRYVQLRGTPPEYTNFNVNGEQIPSPEGNVRYVGMDVIAADQIEFIEITKVLTPDMDADGIAGNVNIITKTPASGDPEMGLSLAGGYNDLMGTTNQNLNFTYGQRYKKVGFQMNASYNVNNFGSHNMEFDYTRGPVLSQAQTGDVEEGQENYHLLYDDLEYRHYTITRKRVGLSGSLDYKFNENHQVYIRGMYNRFSDDEVRRRKSHGVSDANDPLTYRSAGMSRDVRDRFQLQEIATINTGASHTLPHGIKINYEGSYSRAVEQVPNYLAAEFDQGLVSIRVDKTEPKWPQVYFLSEDDSLNAFNFGSYEFDGITFRESMVIDENYSGKFDMEIPYNLNQSNRGYIKFGGKVRMKHKTRDNSAKDYTYRTEGIDIYSQPAPNLGLGDMASGFEEHNLLGNGYTVTMIPSSEKMFDFYEANQQHFKLDEAETWEDNYQEDYSAYENIYAGYLMIRHDIEEFMIIGGVRYEHTDIKYTVQNAWLELHRDSTDRGLLKKLQKNEQRTIPFVLPQVQLKYALNSKTNFRAAYTHTYSRPNFDDVLPYRIENEDGDVEKGNPALKLPLAMNFDVLAEYYFHDNGLLSGGLFYKKIENPIFTYVFDAHEGENFNLFGSKEITIPINGEEAYVYGAEALCQLKFSGLPGILGNFGIFSNYTFTESQATVPFRKKRNEQDFILPFDDFELGFLDTISRKEHVPLQGQARHSGNLALFYESEKLYIKISSVMHSPFLDELGTDAGLDVYYEKRLHVDFNANYQVNENLNVFLDAVNLTNSPLRYYLGTREFFKQHEFYSWWARVGVKLKL